MVVILDRRYWLLTVVIGAMLANTGNAECPNACSGHGDCDAYDMCACYPGFMGNDCSERICQFGRAHADTPKGNLDGSPSGIVSTSTVLVGSQMYPNGVVEHILNPGSIESVHEYMECSNKGTCDRQLGSCQCFPAYEGSACQRASCPNNCNGKGVCRTNRELVVLAGTTYGLWDADSIMGCDCDPGYTGPDCSLRTCPYGIDPLFDYTSNDDIVRHTKISFELFDASGVGALALTGTIRVKFYDVYGENWITEPFDVSSQSASAFEALFENLPNNAVPSISCSVSTTAATTLTFTCEFTSNPGWLKTPEIIMVDDAGGVSASGVAALEARVYDSGNMGEFTDYFNKNCGVTITLQDPITNSPYKGSEKVSGYVSGSESALKSCLGDSDGDPSTNVEVEQWNYGNFANVDPTLPGEFPHIVKLVKTDGTIAPINAIVWFDGTDFQFQTNVPAGSYAIYATDGTLSRVVVDVGGSGDMDSLSEMGSVSTGFKKYSNAIYTTAQIGCSEEDGSTLHCIEKGDLIVLGMTTLVGDGYSGFTTPGSGMDADTAFGHIQPNTAEFYSVHSIRTKDSDAVSTITVGRSMFYGDGDDSFDAEDVLTRTNDGSTFQMAVPIYKFTPAPARTNQFTYVSQCSRRGLCDTLSGLCNRFPGYTGEACASQDALAV